VDTIVAPLFPTRLPWVNTTGPQATIQRGRPMLVEFWDFCRPNSMRTLPYLKGWHERYGGEGLRTIGVHCPGFEVSGEEPAVRAAVERLGITYPVLIDSGFEVWEDYGNEGWPARYLFDGRARLVDYHHGEGGYRETELAIQELLGVEREPIDPVRPEDGPGARLSAQTAEQPGAYCGPYQAGGVWAVLEGTGTVRFSDSGAAGADAQSGELAITHPGAYPLIEHDRHTAGTITLECDAGVECLATCFTPGVG
jgi:hypothetical protein